MIAIVDTGGANLASVVNALARAGVADATVEQLLTRDPQRIARASHVILPGVGAAGDAMQRLYTSELIDCLRTLMQPVLGICLGMQLLFEHSAEGDTACLDIIPGTVDALTPGDGLTVPHMGWNRVWAQDSACPLLADIPDGSHFYFVHSYAAPVGVATRATCTYGTPFSAIVQRDNYFGIQCHPERSSIAGATLLRNFINL